MLRKICFFVLLVGLNTGTVLAQDTMHTLIKFSKLKYFGIYISPEFQYGQAGGNFNTYAGNSAMLMFNKRWSVGLTGARSLQRDFVPKDLSPLRLQSWFGGAKIEYTASPNSKVHVSFPLVLGYGQARADSVSYTRIYTDSTDVDGHHGRGGRDRSFRRGFNTDYAIIQPGIQLETNVARLVKLYVGANYRFAMPTETVSAPLSKSTLNGLSISAGLKVGLFDYDLEKKRERGWHLFKKRKHRREHKD